MGEIVAQPNYHVISASCDQPLSIAGTLSDIVWTFKGETSLKKYPVGSDPLRHGLELDLAPRTCRMRNQITRRDFTLAGSGQRFWLLFVSSARLRLNDIL